MSSDTNVLQFEQSKGQIKWVRYNINKLGRENVIQKRYYKNEK